MSASIDMTGIINALQQGGEEGIARVMRAVDVYGEVVLLGKSMEICPVSSPDPKNKNYTGHSGALRDSATTEPAVREGTMIVKTLGYGVNYAGIVHERMDLVHDYAGSGNPKGQAKWLEITIKKMAPGLVPFVAGEIGGPG